MKKKEIKKQQSQTAKNAKTKQPFFKRLIENHPDELWDSLSSQLHSAMSIILSCVIALVATILYLSPSSYSYSADNYKFIEDTVLNGYALLDEDGNEVVDDKTGEVVIVPPVISENGIDHVGLWQRIRNFTITTDETTTTLVCTLKTGYVPMFHAKMTFVVDENYAILGTPQKNFDSLQKYQQTYWTSFLVLVIIGAAFIWLLSNCLWHGICVFAKKHYSKTKAQTQTFEEQPQQEQAKVGEVSSTACEPA